MKMRYYYSHNKWELIDVSDPALIDYIEKQNKECQREFWREKKRRTLSLDALLEANVALPTSADLLEILVDEEEKNSSFLKGMERLLTQRQLHILEMHYCAKMNFAEIAQKLGISRSAVAKLKKKALSKLREGLTNDVTSIPINCQDVDPDNNVGG